jgi:hypothetical protein
MKRTLLAGAAAFAVVFSSQAFAQSVAVEIDPAQRATIEDYIVNKKHPVGPGEREHFDRQHITSRY